MSHVAPWLSPANVRVIFGGVGATNVDVVFGDKVLESLVKVLSVSDDLVFGLGIIGNIQVVGAWCLDL